MSRTFLIVLVLTTLVACRTYKQVTFKTDTFMSAGKVQEFQFSVPTGAHKYSADLQQYMLKKYVYEDSSVLYISLDINYGHSPNRENWMKCSKPEENYKCEEGQQNDGRYWREILSNNLLVGYFNVKQGQKALFDTAVESLKSK